MLPMVGRDMCPIWTEKLTGVHEPGFRFFERPLIHDAQKKRRSEERLIVHLTAH
jgi:hypothetical protein